MKGTRFLAFLLAFIMAFSCVGVADVSAAEVKTETLSGNAVSKEVSIVSEEISVELDTSELPDNEELYAGYVESLFYSDLYGDVSTFANVGADKLSGMEKKFMMLLKQRLKRLQQESSLRRSLLLEKILRGHGQQKNCQ